MLPEPVPALVTVPVIPMAPVTLIPLVIELLLSNVRLPVPPIELESVSCCPLVLASVSVVPVEATVSAPLIENAEVALLSVIPVTFGPTEAVIEVVPVLEPVLLSVPALLTAVVDRVVPVVEPATNVTLPVPVIPPVRFNAPVFVVGERPMEAIVTLALFNTMGSLVAGAEPL